MFDSTRYLSKAKIGSSIVGTGWQFTMRTGSVTESSDVPLAKQSLAYRLSASVKTRISARSLHRNHWRCVLAPSRGAQAL